MLVLTLVLAGCSQSVDDPFGYAIAAYSEVHGPPSNGCISELEKVEIYIVSEKELAQKCGVPVDYAWGCHPTGTLDVYVDEAAEDIVTAHEIMHVLLSCEEFSSSANHDHEDKVWSKF